jgi:hypothetical protein
MWVSTNWSINKNSLLCSMRRNNERRIVSFSSPTTILLDVPTSLGDDIPNMLQDIFSTTNVSLLGGTIYKVTISRSSNPIPTEAFRQFRILYPSVSNSLAMWGMKYHSFFDDDNNIQPPPMEFSYIPKTCFWELGFHEEQIVTIGFGTNYTPNITIMTTLELKHCHSIVAINFETELEMLEKLFEQIIDHDLSVEYIPLFSKLISRLRVLGSKIPETLNKIENNTATPSGMVRTEQLGTHNVDHVILSNMVSVSYPSLRTENLFEVGKHFFQRTGSDPSGYINMDDVSTFAGFTAYVSKSTQIVKDLWGLLLPCYNQIVTSMGIKYSEVGTCAEIDGFLINNAPELLINDKISQDRNHPMYFDLGIYRNVFIYNMIPIMINALKSSQDPLTSSLGALVENYPYFWIVKSLFENPRLQPEKILDSEGIIGVTPSLVFSTVKLPFSISQEAEHFIAVASGSWIVKNKDSFSYHGIAKACSHPFPLVKREVEILIRRYLDHIEVGNLPSYVSKIIDIKAEDLVMNVKVSSMNIEKYCNLLTENEIKDISEGSLVPIKIINVKKGEKSESIRINNFIDQQLDLSYYSEELYKVLRRIPRVE